MFSIHVYTSVDYLYHTLNENGEIKTNLFNICEFCT